MLDLLTPLRRVRETAPLVQCMTNFVTVNDCANILLAAGASPTMTSDAREVEEAVAKAQALVCNIGTIGDVEAMVLAGKQANCLGIPVVLDPVAAGNTGLRRDSVRRLLEEVHFAAIRGNASEIRYLAGQQTAGSGVDVGKMDAVTEKNLASAAEMVGELARKTGSVIAVSGCIDLISNGKESAVIRNGCATMARITGSGCMLTALIGAFCGAMPSGSFSATCAAMAVMGVAGEVAEARRVQFGTGNATFRNDLIDAVFNLTEQQLLEGARYEVF